MNLTHNFKNKLLRFSGSLFLSLSLLACGEKELSTAPCYINIDNSIHNDITLSSAMNPLAPGIFCVISQSGDGKYFLFQNNHKQSSKSPVYAQEQKQNMIFGFNNGVIVGFGTLDGKFHAYDLQCPNCYDDNAIPLRARPLSMTDAGIARCPNCGNEYDMNNGGYATKGSGRLTSYPANLAPSAAGTPNMRVIVR